MAMLREPIVTQSSGAAKFLDDKILLDFFENIFDKSKTKLIRKVCTSRNAVIDREVKRLVRSDEYYKWNIYRRNGKKITNFSIIKQAVRIVIYGLGVTGMQLVDDLIDGLKTPEFIIDRNFADTYYKNIPVYILQDTIKNNIGIDLLIFTLKDNILKKELEKIFVNVKIIDMKYIIDFLDNDEQKNLYR